MHCISLSVPAPLATQPYLYAGAGIESIVFGIGGGVMLTFGAGTVALAFPGVGGNVSCIPACAVAVPSISAFAVANPEGGIGVGAAVNFPVQPARISRISRIYMYFFSLASSCLNGTCGYGFQSLL